MKRLLLIATFLFLFTTSALAGEMPIGGAPPPPPPPDGERSVVTVQTDTNPSIKLAAIIESVRTVIITHLFFMR